MQLRHHGITFELDDADPRVRVIETLVFGQPLPAPLPLHECWLRTADAPQPPPPPIDEPWRRFWVALRPDARRWLLTLADGPVLAREARKKSGVRSILGLHRHVTAFADRHRVRGRVLASGRGRSRRFFLPEEVVPVIRQLADMPPTPPSLAA